MDARAEVDRHGHEIGCKDFIALNLTIQADLEALVDLLIVTRRHEAPLRVKSPSHCFVRLGLFYAERLCQGKMPAAINFSWPYLKHEANQNKAVLSELAYGRRDKALMPPGILDGKTIEQIKDMVCQGQIPHQFCSREVSAHKAHQDAAPEPVTFLEDLYNPILRDNGQPLLGEDQGDTQSPARQVDAEEHAASQVGIDPDAMTDEHPAPVAEQTSADVQSDVMVDANTNAFRVNSKGQVVVTRESIPDVVWDAMETVRGRGFLSKFMTEVMDDLTAGDITDEHTLDVFRDMLLTENGTVPEIIEACNAVNWH